MHLYKKISQIGKCFLYFNTIVSSYLSPREEFRGGLITSFAWLILAFTLQQLLCLLLAISFPETYNNAVRMYMFWIVDFYSVEVVKNKSHLYWKENIWGIQSEVNSFPKSDVSKNVWLHSTFTYINAKNTLNTVQDQWFPRV